MIKSIEYFQHCLCEKKLGAGQNRNSCLLIFRFRNEEEQLVKWMEILQCYDCTVMYKPGHKHGNRDAFSRWPCWEDNTVSKRAKNWLLKGLSMLIKRWNCWYIHWNNGSGLQEWTVEQLKASQRKDHNMKIVRNWKNQMANADIQECSISSEYYSKSFLFTIRRLGI